MQRPGGQDQDRHRTDSSQIQSGWRRGTGGGVWDVREKSLERKEAKSGRASPSPPPPPGLKTFSDSPSPSKTRLSTSEISTERSSQRQKSFR